MTLTVKRDGTVTDGHTIVGTIESRPRIGIASALLGTEPTQKEFRGVRSDGVATAWRTTRRNAVQLLERLTAPASATVKVERSIYGPDMFSGWVHWDGHSAGVTSYAHEVDAETGARLWVIDFWAPAGSICPTFANGSGSRGCVKAYTLQPDQAALIDAEVTRQALTI